VFAISKDKKSKQPNARAPIDEIMKYLFGVSKETLINMLNSLFKQNFSVDDATIIQTNSEFVDEAFDIIRGDLFYVVLDESKQHHLHIELQTRADGHMTIRILSYDIKKAAENQRLENKSSIVKYILPKTIVIHVEKSNSIPDSYEFELIDIKADGSEEIIHRVIPVIKYWELTDKDLIEQQLYPLLPLQIFLLRSELKKFAKEQDSAGKNKLIQQIKNLTEKMIIEVKNLAEAGKINKGDDDRIITALAKLIKYLNAQYNFGDKLNQEVDTVIKSVFTTLKEEGVKEGKKEEKIKRAKALLDVLDIKIIKEKFELKDEEVETLIEELKKLKKPVKQ
jgi:hypothetical protein